YMGDIGFDVGGPIIKDKLWFYVGADYSSTVYNIERSFYHQTPNGRGGVVTDSNNNPLATHIDGADEKYQALARSLQVLGKLTWAVNENNKVTATGFVQPT